MLPVSPISPVSLEKLESRQLLSVAASSAAGTLYVYGDDAANGIHVSRGSPGGQNLFDIVVSKREPAGNYTQVYKVADDKIDRVLIYARGGNDRIEVDFAVIANVTINGGHGADYIKCGGVNCDAFGDYQPAFATEADDNAGDTMICNSEDSCALYGQGGNDKLYTGIAGIYLPQFGADALFGGPGNDSFYTTIGSVQRKTDIRGGTGNDCLFATADREINFHGEKGSDTVDFSAAKEGVYAHMDGYSFSGSKSKPNSRHMKISNDVENATGSKYDDDIYFDLPAGQHAFIRGGDGNDKLWGSAGDDFIFAGNGNDTIVGADGDDSLYGEAGHDSIIGGNGNDILSGGAGVDQFVAKDNARDWIYGGTEADLLLSADVIDLVYA